MATSLLQGPSNKRFDLLSLKKNKKKVSNGRKLDEEPTVIVLDDSVDNYCYSGITCKRGDRRQISSSPIVIDDSFDAERNKDTIFKSPPPYDNAGTPNSKIVDLSITPENKKCAVEEPLDRRPSLDGWSPAQAIICASPKFNTTPSRSKDVANESLEECSIKKIHDSHKDILDELYGDVWRSIPSLFKKKHQKAIENIDGVTKKLDFLDDSDKENDIITDVRKFYVDDDEIETARPKIFDIATPKAKDAKIKKKLYTEINAETPEIRKIRKELLNFTEPKPKLNKERQKERLKPQTEKKKTEKPQKHEEKRDTNVKNVRRALVTETLKVNRVLETNTLNVQILSFMASLADNVPSWRCEPTAFDFKTDYKRKRELLTRRLYQEFNTRVFNDQLDSDMPLVWDAKLNSTAGTTTNRLIKTADLVKHRTSSIKLSTKVLDTAQRLRDTLIHEMCHAATWIIDHELRAGHGPLWKKWARRALKAIPELEEISRCHDLEIHFKYSYKCSQCGYTVNRHSKSIDETKKVCGYCRGTFQLILNKKNKDGVVVSTPARKAENGFAKYVKENYAKLKEGRKHAEVMKALSEQYSAKKNQC